MTTTDPHALFDTWLTEAEATEPNDPNACALASVGAGGQPSVRMVLLKGHDHGFIVYTNTEGRKGRELLANPQGALLFHWKTRRRQVRIEGPMLPVEDGVADAYFATRPRTSQLGAWASDQSRPLPDRATFEARLADVETRFAGVDVPRPPHWSGFRLTPTRIEFWEDVEHRLHHRRLFERVDEGRGEGGGWREGLLYP